MATPTKPLMNISKTLFTSSSPSKLRFSDWISRVCFASGTEDAPNRAKDSLREGVDQEHVASGTNKAKEKAKEYVDETKGKVKEAWESAKDTARKITDTDDDRTGEKQMDEDVIELRKRSGGDN